MSQKFNLKDTVREYFKWKVEHNPNRYIRDEIIPCERKYFESIPAGSKVLDVCCGGGRTAVFLAKKEYEVVGLDFVEEMCRKASENAREKYVKAEFVIGDATELPFKDQSFDYAICVGNSLNNLTSSLEIKLVLLEMARVLKEDGGIFTVTQDKFSPIRFIREMHRFVGILPKRVWRIMTGGSCDGLHFGEGFYGSDNRHSIKGFVHNTSKYELKRYMQTTGLDFQIQNKKEYMREKGFSSKFSPSHIITGHKKGRAGRD